MKILLVLGAVLVLYAMFLTPAYFEPADLVVSTGYIIMANEMGIDPIVVYIWAMSGYVALILGIFLGFGATVIHFKHPVIIAVVGLLFASIVFYWVFFESGIL